MIQKITKIICDNCGTGICDTIENPPREYTTFAKEHGWVVKYTNSGRKDFCDEQCYKSWKVRNK